MLAGEVERGLDRAGLRCRDRSRRNLGIRARREDRHRERRHGCESGTLLCGDHAGKVVLGDVRDFMGEHAGEFGFALRAQQQSRVHADESARQGECVDGVVSNSEKLERAGRIRTVADQPIADAVQIVGDVRIVDVSGVGANLAHDALAEFAFLDGGQRALRNIAQVGQFVGVTKCGGQHCDSDH